METFTILLLVIIILGILAILYINIYNHIQFSKTKIEKVEEQIDEDLRTKYDLIVKADVYKRQVCFNNFLVFNSLCFQIFFLLFQFYF